MSSIAPSSDTIRMICAVMNERIGERHASTCWYKNEVPEGLRRSARRTQFWPREVESMLAGPVFKGV